MARQVENGFRYEQFMPFATTVLVVLKICGLIGWSWWWVFSPLWIPVAICLLVVFIFHGDANDAN